MFKKYYIWYSKIVKNLTAQSLASNLYGHFLQAVNTLGFFKA